MAMFSRLSLWLSLASLCSPDAGWAQTPGALSEKDFFEPMPIVLSVSRLPQRLDETPGAVTLIDRDMIRRSGARDVADLLRWVPGFQVSTSFQSGAPLVSYHSAFDMFSNRLQVLVDGRSVYSPYFIGSIGTGLQAVALQDIERIEVLRGANSAAFGSRAILGVINIVTRHTGETRGSQAALAIGGNGVRDAQARLGWGDDQSTYRLTLDRRGDDGLKFANDHNRINRVNFRADLRPRASDELSLRLGGHAINSGKGKPGNIDDAIRDSVFDASFAQLAWRTSLSPDEDFAISLSHSNERYADGFSYPLHQNSAIRKLLEKAGFPAAYLANLSDEEYSGLLLKFGIPSTYFLSLSGESSSDQLTLQHTFRSGPATRVVWGGEFLGERVRSSALFDTDADLVNDFTRLFGNVEWKFAPHWLLNAGAMLEKSSVAGENLAPRLMLNWHVAAGQTLRAGISRSFRTPSAYEKFADVRYRIMPNYTMGPTTLASGQVSSETVLTRELGYLGDFPRWGLNLDVRVFHEQIQGFIRQLNLTLPRDYANDDNVGIRGLEYQAKFRPWAGAQMSLGQTITRIGAKFDDVNDQATNWAAPTLASFVTLHQQLPGNVDLSLMHQNQGRAVLPSAGFGDQYAMSRTDLRLAKAMRWGSTRGELALVIQNLGLPYPDFRPEDFFERRAFVTFSLEH